MGGKSCHLLLLCWMLVVHVARLAPVFTLDEYLSRTRRGDQSVGDETIQQLSRKGHTIAAALQLIENVASGERRSPCQRTSLADIEEDKFNWKQLGQLDRQVANVLKTANVLNHIFLRASNDTDIDPLILYSLIKSNIDNDPIASSSTIAISSASNNLLVPYAYRGSDGIVRTQVMKTSLFDRWSGNDWFWTLTTKNYSDLSSRLANGTLDLLIGVEDGAWTAPYFDCILSTSWHVSFGAPFFTMRGNDMHLKGVVSISMPIIHVDLDQCGSSPELPAFSTSHKCDSSTECMPLRGTGFRRGGYRCYCKASHYPLAAEYGVRGMEYFDGALMEQAAVAKLLDQTGDGPKYPDDFRCLPCRNGCDVCIGDEPCYVEYDIILRGLILCFQSFCSTIVFILALIVFRLRKTKIFSNSMWIMLETVLFGALFLYQTVIVRYFEPSVLTCMVEPWLRGLGFAICYGAITLKIYRVLAEFQTRKAHRVCVRDKDLLKYLLGIIFVVIGYLLAWTAVMVDNMNEGYSVLVQERTAVGLKYVMCRALWWDYVTEIGELLFLVFGVFLTYKVRNAKCNYFHEKGALVWAIYIEAMVSLLMYTIRHVVWTNLHPDYIYLLYFLRCQCTITIILFFIYGPKIYYYHHPPEPTEYQPGRQLSSCGDVRDNMPEMMKLHDAITSNGEVDFSEINLSDMDPEDIRTELRRVYTQLQILRNITMRKGNPHISRRRGGRKGTHRRFSLQTFHHRHKHFHDHEHEGTEVSKTPEESTASQDGYSVVVAAASTSAEASTSRDDHNSGTPRGGVTFRDSAK